MEPTDEEYAIISDPNVPRSRSNLNKYFETNYIPLWRQRMLKELREQLIWDSGTNVTMDTSMFPTRNINRVEGPTREEYGIIADSNVTRSARNLANYVRENPERKGILERARAALIYAGKNTFSNEDAYSSVGGPSPTEYAIIADPNASRRRTNLERYLMENNVSAEKVDMLMGMLSKKGGRRR